jgi:predicted site-specific integrase-resolvase
MTELVSNSNLLRAKAAAETMGVSVNMLYELTKRGKLNGVVVKVSPHRGLRYHKERLNQWLENGGLASNGSGSIEIAA